MLDGPGQDLVGEILLDTVYEVLSFMLAHQCGDGIRSETSNARTRLQTQKERGSMMLIGVFAVSFEDGIAEMRVVKVYPLYSKTAWKEKHSCPPSEKGRTGHAPSLCPCRVAAQLEKLN